MRTGVIGLFALISLVVSSGAGAITFGRQDVNNEYPNVASVRGSSKRKISPASVAAAVCFTAMSTRS